MINFGLPDQQNRQEIAAQYAKHLTKPELDEVARVTEEWVWYMLTYLRKDLEYENYVLVQLICLN